MSVELDDSSPLFQYVPLIGASSCDIVKKVFPKPRLVFKYPISRTGRSSVDRLMSVMSLVNNSTGSKGCCCCVCVCVCVCVC